MYCVLGQIVVRTKDGEFVGEHWLVYMNSKGKQTTNKKSEAQKWIKEIKKNSPKGYESLKLINLEEVTND